MDHCHTSAPSSLARSINNDAKPPVVFRRMPSNSTQLSNGHESTQGAQTNVRNDNAVPSSVAPFADRYNAPATPQSSNDGQNTIISLVDEALLRAASLADVPAVAAWIATRIVEKGYDGEMETKFLQTTSLVGHLFKLGAITSLHILSIAETLVFTIDQPMRIQGVMALFASAGSSFCRAECVARTTKIAVKLKEASLARPRNILLRRFDSQHP